MSYSRRQLYALGEPLGSNVTRKTNGGKIIYGGGGSPPPSAPTNTTVTNTNIPDYAQPYVQNMLNAAQAQIYKPDGTTFNPYTPYSTDPTQYVAGFSPLQTQAQTAAGALQTPSTYGLSAGATMGTIGNMGTVGSNMGNAGANYNAMATDPGAMSAFMNPYLQASLAPQLQLANQQYGIAGQQEQSNAAQQGAFGGSREALMNSLNQQNQMLAQNQIIGQGYNTAFNNAQQAQQYGAGLGLQGQQGQLSALQGQMAGANQLAGIGGQDLAAQQSILGTQAQQGALQQQNQQNIINQAVQNYATAQQYPFMQLGTLNSMLRGLPMQQSTTQMYQAPPSTISQLAGLGTAGIGLAGMANATGVLGKADGGVIKAKNGGVIKAAGGIPMSMYSPQQLQQEQNSQYTSPIAKLVATGYMQDDQRLQSNPEAPKMLAQIDRSPTTAQPMGQPINRAGVGAIATPPNLTTMNAAGGGLLAFAGKDESLVPDIGDDARNFKLGSDAIDLNTPKALKTNLKQEDNNPSNSSSTPFTLFGYPVNQAAKDAELTKVNASNWRDQIKPQEAPKTEDSFAAFMRAKDTSPNYTAPVVTAKTIEAGLKAPHDANPIAVPTKEAVPVKAAAPVDKSDYDEIKQMLIDEYKNPSTKAADDIAAQLASVQKRMEERQKMAGYESLARAGFGIMAGTSPYALVNIGQGAPEGLEHYQKERAATAEDQDLINKYAIAGKSADEARHQAVGLNLLKVGEMEEAAKDRLAKEMATLKSTEAFRQGNQDTKNLLAASLIQSRNFKEDTIKGEKASQIGGAISTFDNALNQIDKVQNHPGRYNGANIYGAAASHVPNTDAYDYKTSLQGLKDTQFMAAIAGIKGTGIGRILLPEVQKIQNSTGVLDTHQSKEQFDQQLNNLRNMITAAKSRAIGSANQYGISPQDLGIAQ